MNFEYDDKMKIDEFYLNYLNGIRELSKQYQKRVEVIADYDEN